MAASDLSDTFPGKTTLITGHKGWSDSQVIRAYRSQFMIEEIFHEMKDRHIGSWWPLHHWTDSHCNGWPCGQVAWVRVINRGTRFMFSLSRVTTATCQRSRKRCLLSAAM